jgi:hypothetical protein
LFGREFCWKPYPQITKQHFKQDTSNSKMLGTAGIQATVETHQQGSGVGNSIDRAKAWMSTTERQQQNTDNNRDTTTAAAGTRDTCNNRHT